MQNKHKNDPSFPNMILIGHTSQPTYALGWCSEKPIVASGSQNGDIIIWNLEANIEQQKGFIPGGVLGRS
jgi:WD40 repeat protein